MKRITIIISLISLLSACVFNIKIPPEEKTQPPIVHDGKQLTKP